MSEPLLPGLELDEAEHQALDLLDELALGAAWIQAQTARDEPLAVDSGDPRAVLEAAIRAAGEDPEEVAAAEAVVAGLLPRLVTQVAVELIDAAISLAHAEASEPGPNGPDRGLGRGPGRGPTALDPAQLGALRAAIEAAPELGPALPSAVELSEAILGLQHESIARAVLLGLREQARADLPEAHRPSARAIAERLAAAHPASAPEPQSPSPALDGPAPPGPAPDSPALPRHLLVFRTAAVRLAGPELRARALAADHPHHLSLAQTLVGQPELGPAALVDAFEVGRLALDAAHPSGADEADPAANIDGPKRKFTAMNLVLALIVLGLTLWHYLLR